MLIHILSLFPNYFNSALNESMLKRALQKELLQITLSDIRDFSELPRKKVDERPFGGGPGMVLMAPPVKKAIDFALEEGKNKDKKTQRVIYLSPQGEPLTAKKCRELATWDHIVLLCGHYEGIDERVLQTSVDEEISIGDYVLTSGCPAALVVIDALIRFIPGVIGDERGKEEDSFEDALDGLLDYPHYTKPLEFCGLTVPPELLEGHHEKIKKLRKKWSLERTEKKRPDLLKKAKNS